MTTFADQFKSEISRLAKKEVRAETQALKKASSQYRGEIAALKKSSLQNSFQASTQR